MQQIISVIGSVCILIMVTGILADLGSFPVMEKVIRFIIVIFLIVCIFKSFETTQINIETDNFETKFVYEQNLDYLKEKIISETEKETQELIKNRLEQKNISYNWLSLHILEQNGNLIVKEIVIDCSESEKNEVYDCIKDVISNETEIKIGE